ncbi:beta-propeller domain-containing protein [Pyrobaculum aerophilum]|uniref:Uncharacterized protein n=1 Tax=Pyrobaculum aerophilum TaxID=13773 RepID=A0A371QYE0_9CREN|nr:beta-propeller domain-containing protein [Pyrobaculum aerophilum]RFA95635.1 hypothetical protein CGL52_12620 [Pyrobaculum aerophilum]RFA96334.1 hypothetical protein CGL51_05085 [Pyrobaculum aerophilum]
MFKPLVLLALAFTALALLLWISSQAPPQTAPPVSTPPPQFPVIKLATLELLNPLEPALPMAFPVALYSTSAAVATADMKTAYAANVQVAGVDEEDYVKFDGERLYVAVNGKVYVVDKNLRLLETLDCPSPHCYIFAWGGRVLAIGEVGGNTLLYLYDSSRKVAVYNFTGYPIAARMHNGVVYIVAASPPRVVINGREVNEAPLLSLDLHPNVLIIAGVDLRSPNFNATTYVAGPAAKIYMRENRLYVVTSLGIPDLLYKAVKAVWEDLPVEVRERLDLTNPLTLYVTLREALKNNTSVVEVLNRANITTATRVYIFEGDGPYLRLKAAAEVPGRVLDQFAIEEIDGGFLLATTVAPVKFRVSPLWIPAAPPETIISQDGVPVAVIRRAITPLPPSIWTSEGEPVNAVYIFDENGNLKGSLTGLAPGERIYAARLVKNVLYLVTFRQVDPLFAIDISNPERPKVLGYLKIPGFSEYLHPVGEGRLLGVGAYQSGVKISLFDASNPAAPREVSNITISNAYTPVFYDHHAFSYNPEAELAFIPYTPYLGGLRILFIEVGSKLRVRAERDLPADRAFFDKDAVYLVGGNRVWKLSYSLEVVGEAVLK